jgi:hypothetical protein
MSMLRLGTFETLRTTDAGLDAARQDPGEKWKVAGNRTTEFIEWLRSAADDPTAAGLDARIDALFNAWKEAFQQQEADLETVAMAGRGELAAAVEHLPRTRRESIQGDGTALAQARLTGVAEAIAMGAARQAPPPSEAALFESFLPAPRRQLTTEVLEANTLTELLRARWLMTALSAIGLAIVGFLLFGDKFTGTSGDLMTAFFWGFTSDIGLDALITAATAKKTSTA